MQVVYTEPIKKKTTVAGQQNSNQDNLNRECPTSSDGQATARRRHNAHQDFFLCHLTIKKIAFNLFSHKSVILIEKYTNPFIPWKRSKKGGSKFLQHPSPT